MAEELRFFLRTALYAIVAGIIYWFVSEEPAGTVLLAALVLAIIAFVGVAAAHVPASVGELRPAGGGTARRALGAVNRLIGFHERVEAPPPLEGGPDLVPLGSPWPIVTAASIVVVGLGLIFGSWLIAPGLVLLVIGGFGWVTQLDRR